MLKNLLILLLFLSFSFNVFSNSFLFKNFWKNATLKEVKEKIASGVDINAYSQYYSETALMYAAKHNKNSKIVTTLIANGANIKLKDATGKTAFDYIKINKYLKDTKAYWQLNDTQYKII